jgi:hypothetical protein
MTERKPPDMSFRSWIDQQINEAAERGAFADLPGAGKPLPSKGDEDAAEAWLREYVRREGVSTEEFLPVPLKLRKERERTPSAESVLAAGDMAFLDRLWQDWSPGYDASENLRSVKQCLRGEGNLAAAIGYYRAGEPGLRRPERMARIARMRLKSRPWLAAGRSRRCTCTATVTAALISPSCGTPGVTSRPDRAWRLSRTPATSSRSRSRPR